MIVEIVPQQVAHSMLVPAMVARLQARGREIEALQAQVAQLAELVHELASRSAEH